VVKGEILFGELLFVSLQTKSFFSNRKDKGSNLSLGCPPKIKEYD
jgi:hypothetical protein